MWGAGVEKVTQDIILFLWAQVTEWSQWGNYVGENGDLVESFCLYAKLQYKTGIRTEKIVYTYKVTHLQGKYRKTGA